MLDVLNVLAVKISFYFSMSSNMVLKLHFDRPFLHQDILVLLFCNSTQQLLRVKRAVRLFKVLKDVFNLLVGYDQLSQVELLEHSAELFLC